MNEETAKALIEALNRFSAAVEAVTGPGFMGGKSIQVYHHGNLYQQYLPAQIQLSWPQRGLTSLGG